MTKIALVAAAVLAWSNAAFAGSDHYGTIDANHSAFVDTAPTSSIHKLKTGKHVTVDPRTTTVPPTSESWPDVGQGIWGN